MKYKNIIIISIIFSILYLSLSSTIIKADINQIPTVSITNPEEGDILSGKIIITGTAQDIDGTIQKVEIKFDNNEIGQANGTTDWSYLWDTTKVTDGLHYISVRSYDGEDYSFANRIFIRVDNQGGGINQIPTITIINPIDNNIVAGIINISGEVSGGEGRYLNAHIQINTEEWIDLFIINNTWKYTWDTTSTSNGIYVINARSYDGISYSSIKSIEVTVYNIEDNNNQIPTINIITPANNDTLIGLITINGEASDEDGIIQFVEIKINEGLWENAIGTESWNYSWNTTTLNNGLYTIYAKSYDGKNYSDIYSINIIISNNVEIKNENPTVKIINPHDGDNISGLITINGTASDSDGNIQHIEIKINEGLWEKAIGTILWKHSWDTKELNDDEYIIYVRSYDGENYSNIESISVKVENKSTPGFEFLILLFSMFFICFYLWKKM